MLQLLELTTSNIFQPLFYPVKDGSAGVLYLPNCLWVGHNCSCVIDPEFLKKFIEGRAIELSTIVSDHLYRGSETGDDVLLDKSFTLLGHDGRKWLGFYPFREIVDSYNHEFAYSRSH